MDTQVKQQLEQINESLKAIALNQAAIYAEMEEIEEKISGAEKAGAPEIGRA